MPFPQTPTMSSQPQPSVPPPIGFINAKQSVTDATNMLSMITNTNREPGYTDISLSDQIYVSAATDSETLSRLLLFERQMHQSTLETLQAREQRVHAIEEELQHKTNTLNRWASFFSQCSDLLRKKDSEIQRLRSRIQSEGDKDGFRLDRDAPKDRQIKVLQRKLARMSRKTSNIDDSANAIEVEKNEGGKHTAEDVTCAEPECLDHIP